MFPETFTYHEPASVEEAVSLLAEANGADTAVLAGGHGLIPDMKAGEAAPDVLVDIGGVSGLQGIERETGEDRVRIGARTTHAELLTSDLLASHAPLLQATAREVADLQIRNVGTVGGNLAEADPEADLPAAILAAEAIIEARGPDGRRSIPAAEFFAGRERTVLADDELLTAVHVPGNPTGSYVKRTHPTRGYAMIGVAAALDTVDGVVQEARVGMVGAADRPIRLSAVEQALIGEGVADASVREEAARRASVPETRRYGDAYASGTFRANVLPEYVEQAIADAVEGGVPA